MRAIVNYHTLIIQDIMHHLAFQLENFCNMFSILYDVNCPMTVQIFVRLGVQIRESSIVRLKVYMMELSEILRSGSVPFNKRLVKN